MSEFTPAASWSAARKVAGASDSRQVRDVKTGNAITHSKMPFLAMFADKVPGEDGKVKDQSPTLPSRGVATLTPELNDDEVAPNTFRLTANAAATAVGSSVDLELDDVSGLAVGMLLSSPNDGSVGRITALAGTTATVKMTYAASDGSWTAGEAGVKNLEKLQSANSDAPTVGVGTYREQINRTNGLQFSLLAMSQGILQEQLALHGNPGGEGPNQDWKREQKLKMLDFQRQRENHLILSPTYFTEGSGDSRVIHSKGMVGWAGGVTPNEEADGRINFDDFVNVHMASAREGGGGSVVYGLCGLRVMTALTGLFRDQIRLVNNQAEKYKAAFREFETPAGTLRLIRCDAMDTQVRDGQMITFMEDYLERVFLRGLDLKYMEGLELNNILGKRAALMVCEALLVSNVKSLKLHTGLRMAA